MRVLVTVIVCANTRSTPRLANLMLIRGRDPSVAQPMFHVDRPSR
jgi:hypothetical protein